MEAVTPAPAGWWPRFGAWLIDTVALLTAAGALFLVVWATSSDAGTAGIAAAVTWAATDYLARGLLYAPLLMSRRGEHNGQTLGKQLAGVRAVREDGRPFGYRAAVGREWLVKTLLFQVAGVAFTGGIATFLNYIWPWWDERKRALHDRVASTLVARAG
jgi:uncharacterized RDD family membrane protein YckC